MNDKDKATLTKDPTGQRFLSRLQHRQCFGGLDLAAVHDLTAFVLVFPVRNFLYVYPWFFLPEEGLAERSRKDGVEYVDWAKQGFIETTPGSVTDWRFVTERIKQIAHILNVVQIGYDRYGARDTAADLSDEGIDVIDVPQGPLTFNAPLRRLNELVLTQRLIHTGHPVLTWNITCTSVKQDASENLRPVKPDRQKSTKRIDGTVGLLDAMHCAMRHHSISPGIL